MTTKEKLDKRRDELAIKSADRIYDRKTQRSDGNWQIHETNVISGFNTLAPTWLMAYEALKGFVGKEQGNYYILADCADGRKLQCYAAVSSLKLKKALAEADKFLGGK